MKTRRAIAGGLLTAVMAPAAFAARESRAPLPGGGSVAVPSAYEPIAPDDYRYRNVGALIAYRHYRSMLSGTNECDGMIAVARAADFESLEAFVAKARGALTTRWAYADESEGRWYGRPEKFAEAKSVGAAGEVIVGQLSVHVVGFFDVYDKPAKLYAHNAPRGLMIAIWIFESHGGEAKARKIAEVISESFAS